MGTALVFFGIILVMTGMLAISALRIAAQYQRAVIVRLGRYHRTAGPGLFFKWPLIEWLVMTDLRTRTTAVEAQETITRDNVPIKINAVIWQRVNDPRATVLPRHIVVSHRAPCEEKTAGARRL